MSMNIQGDKETCHPARRPRTDKSRNTVTRNWVLHCYAPGVWRTAEKDQQWSDPSACNWELTFHWTKLPWRAFRTFMRLVGALKQDLNASAHTERLLPCSSANLVSFCWLLFHVWPDPTSLQIRCFLCFHIEVYLHTCYSCKPITLLFSNLARI